MTTQPRVLLTRADVAAMFEVHPDTISTWTEQGLLPSLRLPSGQHRYRRPEIEKLLTEGAQAAS